MIVFSSFNDTNLSHSMLADCCMLKSQEWGFMAVVGQCRPPWSIDARNRIKQKTSSPGPATTATHHTTMMYRIGRREEATDLAWRLPRLRLRSRPSWLVDACLLAYLPSKTTLTTTQLRLSTHRDQNGRQWPPWCPTPGAGAYNSRPECWLIVVCGGAGSEAPWRPWDDGDRHGRWGSV